MVKGLQDHHVSQQSDVELLKITVNNDKIVVIFLLKTFTGSVNADVQQDVFQYVQNDVDPVDVNYEEQIGKKFINFVL